jgi:hypothetical protein
LAYTLASDAAYIGGILDTNGDIHFIPYRATVGQKISTEAIVPFPKGVLLSPYLNKF